jgi:hypothetical protein
MTSGISTPMTTRQWNPGELLEITGYFWKTAVLNTAIKPEVFTILSVRNKFVS